MQGETIGAGYAKKQIEKIRGEKRDMGSENNDMSTIQELSKAFIYSDSAVALQAALKDSGNESLSKIADKMESGSIHFVELEKISKVYKEGGPAEAIKELADLLKTTKEAEQQ